VINDPSEVLMIRLLASKYQWPFHRVPGLEVKVATQKVDIPANTYSLMSTIRYDIAGFSRCLVRWHG
jgi:hypothetical protein